MFARTPALCLPRRFRLSHPLSTPRQPFHETGLTPRGGPTTCKNRQGGRVRHWGRPSRCRAPHWLPTPPRPAIGWPPAHRPANGPTVHHITATVCTSGTREVACPPVAARTVSRPCRCVDSKTLPSERSHPRKRGQSLPCDRSPCAAPGGRDFDRGPTCTEPRRSDGPSFSVAGPLSSLVWWHAIRLATLNLVIPRRSSLTPRSLPVRAASRMGPCRVSCMYSEESSHDARGRQLRAARRRAPLHGYDRARQVPPGQPAWLRRAGCRASTHLFGPPYAGASMRPLYSYLPPHGPSTFHPLAPLSTVVEDAALVSGVKGTTCDTGSSLLEQPDTRAIRGGGAYLFFEDDRNLAAFAPTSRAAAAVARVRLH